MKSPAFAEPIILPTLDLPLRTVDDAARYVAARLDPYKTNAEELALLAELEGTCDVAPADDLRAKVSRWAASIAA